MPINKNDPLDSAFLRSRGSCCKSTCLHCPYGYTLSKLSPVIHQLDAKNKHYAAAKFIYDIKVSGSSLSNSLLESAFKVEKTMPFLNAHFKVVTLKEIVCGLVLLDSAGSFKKLYLADEFDQQGITDTIIISIL